MIYLVHLKLPKSQVIFSSAYLGITKGKPEVISFTMVLLKLKLKLTSLVSNTITKTKIILGTNSLLKLKLKLSWTTSIY